jgi:hypothetical protein
MNYSRGWRSADEVDVVKESKRIFDKSLGTDDLGRLVAAPEGSEIEVTTEFDELRVAVKLPDDKGDFVRRFQLENGKTPYVIHDNFDLEETGTGLGARIFAESVDNYVALGLTRIETFAAGHPGSGTNGYYTWPRLGFEAEIEGPNGNQPVSDLMRSQAGRDWWKTHGHGFDGTFDLSDGSESREVLAEYIKLKRSQR